MILDDLLRWKAMIGHMCADAHAWCNCDTRHHLVNAGITNAASGANFWCMIPTMHTITKATNEDHDHHHLHWHWRGYDITLHVHVVISHRKVCRCSHSWFASSWHGTAWWQWQTATSISATVCISLYPTHMLLSWKEHGILFHSSETSWSGLSIWRTFGSSFDRRSSIHNDDRDAPFPFI